MEDIRWTTELLHPTELEAGSIAEVVFRYSNQNEYDHRIRSVVIAPSWDLTQEIEVSITDGLVVPSKEEKCLPATKIEIPSEIGGRQGFRVGFELSEYTKNNNYSFKTRWDGSISRVEVRDANEYRPLLCVSGGDEDVSVIRELIYNWGFDVQEVHNQQDVVGYFNKNEDKPIAAFGAAFPNDNDSSSRPLLNTTVSVALSYDVIAVVFKHASADLPDLPDTCVIIEFDPTDELDLEIQSSPFVSRNMWSKRN